MNGKYGKVHSMLLLLYIHRNRLLEIFTYLLPIDEKSGKVETTSTFNAKELDHMKKNYTLEVPPGTFKKSVLKSSPTCRADGDDDEVIKELKYKGFTLEKTFPQNICLTRDGSIVFCDEFTKSSNSDDEDEEPLVVGYAFGKVRKIIHEQKKIISMNITHMSSFQILIFLWFLIFRFIKSSSLFVVH